MAAALLKTLPTSFRKLVVKKLSPVFKEAVCVVNEPLMKPRNDQVLVRNRFVGINASDVNIAAGRYLSQGLSVPFDLGFEGVGEVVGFGDNVTELKLGQPVMYISMNAFSEYVYLPENDLISVREAKPEFLPLLVSGATASLSLDKAGHIIPGDKVLVTAAAGGTGHVAVQWAKHAGCHVIGLCSSQEKVNFLQSIGCDRPINYREENLRDVLHNEYPNGLDVIWETIGGSTFDTLFKHLAVKGRLVVVGAVSGYKQESFIPDSSTTNMPMKLLLNSSTVSGFLLTHYKSDIPHYISLLVKLMYEEKLKLQIDTGVNTLGEPFTGLEHIPLAVEYLFSGKNKGKVIVAL